MFSNSIMENRKLTLDEERELWRTYAPPEWSQERVEQFIYKSLIVAPKERAKFLAEEHAKAMTEVYSNTEDGVLITIMIDQKSLSEADAVKAQYAVIDDLRKAKYRWLIQAEACFEYYGKEGWNPHIHIATKRIDKECKIRGNLIDKFIKKQKHGVYRIQVDRRPYKSAWKYCAGEKDSEEKMLNVEKDKKFRQLYSIDNLIKIEF